MRLSKETPREHDCMEKRAGSAEAMDPAMAVHINKDIIHEKRHSVRKLVMDDDTTAIAKVHSDIDDIQTLRQTKRGKHFKSKY